MELDLLRSLNEFDDDSINEIVQNWTGFCACTEALLGGAIGDVGEGTFASFVQALCARGFGSLVQDHLLYSLEKEFKLNTISKIWHHFDASFDAYSMKTDEMKENWPEEVLKQALAEIGSQKVSQENCILMLAQSLDTHTKTVEEKHVSGINVSVLLSKYQLMVSSVLLTSLPQHFPEILHLYFGKQLEILNMLMSGHCQEEDEAFVLEIDNLKSRFPLVDSEICVGRNYHNDMSINHDFSQNIGRVVHDLRNLGFASLTEDAYASAIFSLLKTTVHNLAGDDYQIPVLESIKVWIQAVPLQFLYALLPYLGDTTENDIASVSPLASLPLCFPGISMSSEALVRWKLRLEYFAYETLQDLRIGKLFEIIVDYPDSSPAIDDLRQCLEYTGQHFKLIDSFIYSLRYRLLTAGASTNDILHQYVSTIKALRTIDPPGAFLEAVGEPIRDYLRGRKDTIKCIVTMLTGASRGNSSGTVNSGDNLLEELNRDSENRENTDFDGDVDVDDKQAWSNAERWEPDPVVAGPSKGGTNRRKVDILGMIVGIIGSKDQLFNEYRVMLAEKLLDKSDYDIDSEIRTLELLKIHFGESSMRKCEIMLNDLLDSKRTNANIKASLQKSSNSGDDSKNSHSISLNTLDATIISSNFWPSIQAESLNIPSSMNTLLSEYAQRFHQIKTPRKLLWLKNLGTVKLELQFEDRSLQFTVTPVHAVIIMKFQEQTSWTLMELANAIYIPVDVLNRGLTFWINKGIIAEMHGVESDVQVFTIVEGMIRNDPAIGSCELVPPEEEGDRCVASVEEQLQKEMTIYEKFIIGMLTNFGSMALDRIHNTLKIFCIAEPAYDKSLQQLQSFLSYLVLEEKLELRDGTYFLKK